MSNEETGPTIEEMEETAFKEGVAAAAEVFWNHKITRDNIGMNDASDLLNAIKSTPSPF